MVPSTIVFVDELPLTRNGKIDRDALPAAADERPPLDVAYAVPLAGVEERIAAVWQELLGLRTVGRNDNFFDLGGHSLLVLQAQQQLQAALGWRLSVVDMFRYPTIRALAAHITPAGEGGESDVSSAHVRADHVRNRLEAMRHQRAAARRHDALETTGA
jgi:hypothetical protein